ncbi:hypothetical protein EJ04DRAFT_512682 [Polyplosphaeria fusca]|uniref:Prion-inhibition and propagation HeLo domain-containing protein n=1 Tax=Polyplosphaeria fusca TaxID=682080 RepID=A0A9P4QZS1_9PLEO|nr:hypothetical protein EJ04DRAFT_512682 [Polyplosphaeria fusca]
MEPVSLAVSVGALAGLFNNAVDCFEYVQLGRSFGTDFQTSLLKLDNARLRLSRWGQAVGLSGNLEYARSLQEAAVSKENIDQAEEVLGQIIKLFAEAEGISTEYKRSANSDDRNFAILEAHADMDDLGQTLHEKMRELCIKRQNGTTLRKKVKWALYEEKHFKKLLKDIVDLVSDLLEVFPAVKQEQLKLCEIEVSEIGMEFLSVLLDIVRAQDKDLEAAISAAMKSEQSKQGAAFNNYNSKIANQAASIAIHGGQTIHL